MKLIDRYILRTFLIPLVICAVAFNLIYVVYDLYDNFDLFVKKRAGFRDVMVYYGHLLPAFAWIIMPTSLLLGVLYALYQLTRHNELTAMRASGISLYRLLMPNVALGLLVAVGVGVVDETVGPTFRRYCQDYVSEVKAMSIDKSGGGKGGAGVRRGTVNEMVDIKYKTGPSAPDWHIGSMDLREETFFRMEDITVRKNYEGVQEKEYEFTAGSAVYRNGEWLFRDVRLERFEPGNRPHAGGVLEYRGDEMYRPGFTEPPEVFMRDTSELLEEFMTAREIRARLKRAGDRMRPSLRQRLRTEFHSRLARPLACFIATLLGIPFGFQTARKGFFVGIVVCLASYFGYFALYLVMIYMGKGGAVPPMVGGWVPNLVYVSLGLFLFSRMRQ